MSKYRVSFKRQGTGGDTREYGIIVEADSLGDAEPKAVREIQNRHAKGFLTENNIIKIEQVE